MDEIKAQLQGCNVEELIDIQVFIENLLDSKSSDVLSGFAYDQIRMAFDAKFSSYQIEAFKTWRMLPPAKRSQFHKAWTKAIKFFLKLDKRFKANDKLSETIICMIVESPFFHGKLLFTDLLESLNQIEILFDNQFPGYRAIPDAMDLLVESMTNG